MSKVLFLSMPSHGNVNPTLGLVAELVKRGEEIIYFCSDSFKEKIEGTGAQYSSYNTDLDIFKMHDDSDAEDPFFNVIRRADDIICDILAQTKDIHFDYIIHAAAFPYTGAISQILKLPTVSSLAVFSGLSGFFEGGEADEAGMPGMEAMDGLYKEMAATIANKYGIHMPGSPLDLLFNKGDLNIVYTSEYFIPPADLAFLRRAFGDTLKLVGPPVYERKETMDFPFERLKDKTVIYISLGTVFSNYDARLYDVFFNAFAGKDVMVVMAAYNVDLSQHNIPVNFIVSNYVPQAAVLKYTDVAVTHAGMNSMSDLIDHNVPFVALPMGADQPELAARAQELGAAIALDVNTLSAEQLSDAVDKLLTEPAYREQLNKIKISFDEADGYSKAADEVFALKEKMKKQ